MKARMIVYGGLIMLLICPMTATLALAGSGTAPVTVMNTTDNPVPVSGTFTLNVENQFFPVGRDCTNPLNLVEGADLERCPIWSPTHTFEVGGGLQLQEVDLKNSNLRGAVMFYDNLYRANLIYSNLSGANLRRTNLNYAQMDGSDLRNTNLSSSELRYADLKNTNLSGANLYGSDLTGANLSGANLSGANLFTADLTGVYWGTNTKCPDGSFNQDNDPPTCAGDHLKY